MEKKLLCIAISLACLPAYAENVFTLGQIEIIGEKASDLSTARIDQAELQKNNQDRVSDVSKKHTWFVCRTWWRTQRIQLISTWF